MKHLLKAAIEKVPAVMPYLRGRAWWLGLEVEEAKTYSYYLTVLKRDMRRLYNGKITEAEFVDTLAAYVGRQVRRAWNEGMRLNGLNPPGDMTAEWEAIYQDIVTAEYQYIDRIAAEIVQAAQNGDPLDPFIKRAELWANRYTDVVNRALAITKPGQLLRWEYGDTIEHCDGHSTDEYNPKNCLERAGKIKTGREWLSDVMPQSHELDCGGWRCGCRLINGETGMLFALDYQRVEMLFAPAEVKKSVDSKGHWVTIDAGTDDSRPVYIGGDGRDRGSTSSEGDYSNPKTMPKKYKDAPITILPRRKYIAMGNAQGIFIYKNASAWKDMAKYRKEAYENGWTSTDDVNHTIRHEYAHYWNANHNKNYERAKGVYGSNEPYFRKVASKVSRYAATNGVEFLSETYAGLADGKKYDEDVMNLYKIYGGQKP